MCGLQNFINKNGVLSSAMAVLSKTVNRFEDEAGSELDLRDAIMLQECAQVIARSTPREVLSALKGMKAVNQI
jgi:hypothetical protein